MLFRPLASSSIMRGKAPKIANGLRNDDAVFTEQATDLVHKSNPTGDQSTANSMNSLNSQLFSRLDWHEPHGLCLCGCCQSRSRVRAVAAVEFYTWGLRRERPTRERS